MSVRTKRQDLGQGRYLVCCPGGDREILFSKGGKIRYSSTREYRRRCARLGYLW